MAKVDGLIVEQDIVAQEFDLEELLGIDLSSDDTLAAEIGQDIVEYIKGRAEKGIGVGGKQLRTPYSKEYASSAEFKAAGKKASKVNMTLTGDMLDSIEVLDFDGQVLTVGIENDQAPKAHGHMTGKNGEVPNMKREFFGLTKSELKDITSNYASRIEDAKPKPTRVEDLITPEEDASVNNTFKTAQDFFNLEENK